MPHLPRLLVSLLLAASAGCRSPRPTPPVPQSPTDPPPTSLAPSSSPQSSVLSPHHSSTPYILHLPGVSGPLPIDHALTTGLAMAHLPSPVIYDWTCNDPGLHALTAYPRNQQQAQLVADKLTAQYRAHPTQPIILTSHSGGTGIAIWALEKCPPDVKIQTLLLMESALSPTYDLSPALAHVTGHAYAFFSPHDNIVLGTGTSAFGTIDRVFTPAAGMVGFQQPAHPKDPSQYAKLVPMPYSDDWMALGNPGDHIGPMRRAFASQILAPLLGGTPPPLLPTTRPLAGTQRVPSPPSPN